MPKEPLILMMCEFQRRENGPKEKGVLVNEGQLILDEWGKVVQAPIWNYWRREFEFCVQLDMTRK